MTTTLTRSRRVLHVRRALTTPAGVAFAQEDDARPFYLDVDSWIDMGEPETITLSIEPGDLLNAEEPS